MCSEGRYLVWKDDFEVIDSIFEMLVVVCRFFEEGGDLDYEIHAARSYLPLS